VPTGYQRRAFRRSLARRPLAVGGDRGSAFAGALTANRGPTSTFHRMIPEIDIWRVANLMLKRHGDETTVESAKRTDDLAANGNAAGRCQSGIGLSGQSVDGNVIIIWSVRHGLFPCSEPYYEEVLWRS